MKPMHQTVNFIKCIGYCEHKCHSNEVCLSYYLSCADLNVKRRCIDAVLFVNVVVCSIFTTEGQNMSEILNLSTELT